LEAQGFACHLFPFGIAMGSIESTPIMSLSRVEAQKCLLTAPSHDGHYVIQRFFPPETFADSSERETKLRHTWQVHAQDLIAFASIPIGWDSIPPEAKPNHVVKMILLGQFCDPLLCGFSCTGDRAQCLQVILLKQ
jgi:hypothetical protein